jgi:hypothetical protein
MNKKLLSALAVAVMVMILVISSVTPVMAASSLPDRTVLSTTTTITLSASTVVLGGTASIKSQVTYISGSSTPKPTGTLTFQVQQVSTTPGMANPFVTFNTVNLVSSTNTYYSKAYSPTATGNYVFRAIYSGDTYYKTSTSASGQLRVNAGASSTGLTLNSSSIKMGSSVVETVRVRGLGGLFSIPAGIVDFQFRYTLIGPWATYSSVKLNSGAASVTFKPSASGNWYFRAVYNGDTNYKGSQSADEKLSVTIR